MIITNNLWIFFTYSLVLALLSHRFFVIRSEKYKIKKVNDSAERWSSQSKPVLGGITFYIMFLFALINYTLFFDPNNLLQGHLFGAILVVTIAFLMGLADDMLNTPPGFKFIMQFICAGILIYSGTYIQIFESMALNYSLTVFWVVGIMNSLNMLDNMDAITTSVSSTILIGTVAILISMHTDKTYLVISIGSLAGLIAFLYYNWNPSKMYMGDNGSQFIGALLAIIGIRFFWNAPVYQNMNPIFNFVLVASAFVVPISDTTTVTINRILKKKSPFVGGRDHTTHHLSYFGIKDRNVATILFSVNALFVSAVSYLVISNNNNPVWAVIIGSLALLTFLTLYSITKISKPPVKK